MIAPASVILVSVITILSCKSWCITPHTDRKQLCGVLLFAPFLILLVVIILTGSLYFTTALDSLSYRIPRMLMWLQEGRVHYINNPDARLNFMTPVWEFASTPIYQITGFRFLWLGSAISWVLLYLSLFVTSFCISSNADSRKWLTMIPAASVGFVLQASSTMNDIWAAALVLISLVFIIAFEKKPSFGDIVSSGLALSLAAGVKPHFAVLGLPTHQSIKASKHQSINASTHQRINALKHQRTKASTPRCQPRSSRSHQHQSKWNPPQQIVGENGGTKFPRNGALIRAPHKANGAHDFSKQTNKHNGPMSKRRARRGDVSKSIRRQHHSQALPNGAAGLRERGHVG